MVGLHGDEVVKTSPADRTIAGSIPNHRVRLHLHAVFFPP